MKIKSLEINSFRGIPKRLTIEFPVKNNKPSSLIILGDNGSGKSSIVDALEFCLQGHISQSESLNAKNLPSVKSFASPLLPSVKVKFENDETIERKLIKDEQGLLFDTKGPSQYFAISPFVLRRHDILRFIDSDDSERTLVFSNYLRESENSQWIEHPKDELTRLRDERVKLKEERDRLISLLSTELKIPIEQIPFERKDFNHFIKENIYRGISKAQFETNNLKLKVNQKAVTLAEETLKAIENHRKLKNQINEFSVSKEKKSFPRHLLPQLQEFLTKVGEKLTHSFLEISPIEYIEKITVKYDPKNALVLLINVVLKNKNTCSPKQILSEANLDLLALLFFLSFVQESSERGQSKFLILDDVLQSVDATIRVSFISYLLKNFADWQFIITAHDRLWHRQLNELMKLNNHQNFNIAINNWSFENGPELQSAILSLDASLTSAISNGNITNICSDAGLLLEQISDNLSVNLNISIQRKKDDRYTLGDLWPGLAKILKRTILRDQIEEVDKWLHLRNLIGAHYNEWATSLSLEEAKSFGKSVLQVFNSTRCSICQNWIISNSLFSFYSCKCGNIQIQKSFDFSKQVAIKPAQLN